MDDELADLTNRWIIAFCEAPVLLDKDLMRRVLAEAEVRRAARRDDRSGVYQGERRDRHANGSQSLRPAESLIVRGRTCATR